jgi:hypothetical protein
MPFAQSIRRSPRVRNRTIFCLFAAVAWPLLLIWIASVRLGNAQSAPQIPLGLAWDVKGLWRADGHTSPLQTGDAIRPGSLIWPMTGSTVHSIVLLLPDGQRVLYECFQSEDCGRGFRVPALYRAPDPNAPEILWRIHAVLTEPKRDTEAAPRHGPPLPRDEAVVTLNANAQAEIAGLVAALPDGHYTYTERAIDRADAHVAGGTFDKRGASITLNLPSPGLYDVIIADRLNTQRIELRIAALKVPRSAVVRDSFDNAKDLLEDWNDDYQGWPIHDFQRAYLESLMLDVNPPIPPALSITVKVQKADLRTVADPVFMTRPGVLQGDTGVLLRCDTPGATIHFTVDGSQPFASSLVYSAPIMVKGTGLTIKAFATAKGKDPSAVVTGIFRLDD